MSALPGSAEGTAVTGLDSSPVDVVATADTDLDRGAGASTKRATDSDADGALLRALEALNAETLAHWQAELARLERETGELVQLARARPAAGEQADG